jgi:hypothetical protein
MCELLHGDGKSVGDLKDPLLGANSIATSLGAPWLRQKVLQVESGIRWLHHKCRKLKAGERLLSPLCHSPLNLASNCPNMLTICVEKRTFSEDGNLRHAILNAIVG